MARACRPTSCCRRARLLLTMMGAGEDAGLTGDLDLTGNVKVTGQGAATTLIDGTGLGDRGFHVQSDGTLTVSNIGSSGMDGVGPGGAILNDGGDVTIQNSTISNNSTTGAGGAVNNQNEGTLTITGVNLLRQSGKHGRRRHLQLRGRRPHDRK